MRWQLPLFAVLVQGPSMVPTLRSGDALVVRRNAAVRAGDVVVARFRRRPNQLVVKRAVRPQDGGWWIEGDNPLITDDSQTNRETEDNGREKIRYYPKPGRLS